MESEYANEILACLPQERTYFPYFRDRYALQLLGYASGNGKPVDALRRTHFARLLNKPVVRDFLADCGDGTIDRERLDAQWQEPLLPFLLTAGLWGARHWSSHNQTSRPGFNLVLRLNFNHDHDRRYQELFAPYYWGSSLNLYRGHPVMKNGERPYYRQTLAWARLDIDLEHNQALIEEIQTDWVREANDERRDLPKCAICKHPGRSNYCRQVAKARHYLDEVLPPYAEIWDEAMLSAVLFFLHEELGLTQVWYHSWDCGNALKRIDGYRKPPRSLYYQLPRRFCFIETNEMPQMLLNRITARRLRKAHVEPRFYRLDL